MGYRAHIGTHSPTSWLGFINLELQLPDFNISIGDLVTMVL